MVRTRTPCAMGVKASYEQFRVGFLTCKNGHPYGNNENGNKHRSFCIDRM